MYLFTLELSAYDSLQKTHAQREGCHLGHIVPCICSQQTNNSKSYERLRAQLSRWTEIKESRFVVVLSKWWFKAK